MEEHRPQTVGQHGCLLHSDCNRRRVCSAPGVGQTNGQTGYRKGMFLKILKKKLYTVGLYTVLRPHSI